MTDYNDKNWHAWNMGVRPLHPKTTVTVTYPFGHTHVAISASSVNWEQPLLFKIIKEYKEPLEAWAVDSHLFETKEQAKSWIAASINICRLPIHLREVRGENE